MEGLKWGCGTSKPGKRSQWGEETVGNDGKGGTSWWGMEGSCYHNPDRLCRLIGPRNEVEVIVNEVQATALVDFGAQISAISMAFAKCHELLIWLLQQLLGFEGFGGVAIPYIRYTQVRLQIPGIQGYEKNILVFIQKDSRYSEHVPVILGMLHIKDMIHSATKEELARLGEAWEMGTLGSFVSAQRAQLEETPMIQQVDHYVRLMQGVKL